MFCVKLLLVGVNQKTVGRNNNYIEHMNKLQQDLLELYSFPEVREITKFSDRIWLSGIVGAGEFNKLKELGITAVANLTHDDIGAKAAGFNCLVLNQYDGDVIPAVTLEIFLKWMDNRWENGDKILLHCHAGISRTPSFLIAWFMHKQGMNRDWDLRSEWSNYEDKIVLVRPIIMPHYKLKTSIIRYFEEKAA